MEISVNQRIKEFLIFKRISINALCKELNLKQSTINSQLKGTATLSIESVLPIIKAFPSLSTEWLFRGSGKMELSDAPDDPELKAVCIEQAKEIYRLKLKVSELEGEKKDRA